MHDRQELYPLGYIPIRISQSFNVIYKVCQVCFQLEPHLVLCGTDSLKNFYIILFGQRFMLELASTLNHVCQNPIVG